MTFVKVLGALMVLHLGSNFSFELSDTYTEYPDQGHEITFEINKNSSVLFDSGLTAPCYVHKIPFSINDSKYFRFCSSRTQAIAQQYIRFPNFINLALDVRDVIFPFHSFP